MADRKAELEKKRKKLDELRKARELKKAESKDKEVDWPASIKINYKTLCTQLCSCCKLWPCMLMCLMVCINFMVR